jgi:hypothetical protein
VPLHTSMAPACDPCRVSQPPHSCSTGLVLGPQDHAGCRGHEHGGSGAAKAQRLLLSVTLQRLENKKLAGWEARRSKAGVV